jgi:hypothetical protein
MFPLERFFRPPMARPLWVLLAIFALGLQSTALLIHFQLTPHVHPLALFASGTGGGAETGHHSRGEPISCAVWCAVHACGPFTPELGPIALDVPGLAIGALPALLFSLPRSFSPPAGFPRAPPPGADLASPKLLSLAPSDQTREKNDASFHRRGRSLGRRARIRR